MVLQRIRLLPALFFGDINNVEGLIGGTTDASTVASVFGNLAKVSDFSEKSKNSASAALALTISIINDLGVNGATPDVYSKLKNLEEAIADIQKATQDLTEGQAEGAGFAKEMLDALNKFLDKEAKKAGMDDMGAGELSTKDAKDLDKVNEKLEEITAKLNALQEAMNVQDVVVKTWYESGD